MGNFLEMPVFKTVEVKEGEAGSSQPTGEGVTRVWVQEIVELMRTMMRDAVANCG